MVQLYSENLTLRTVTSDDLAEVARMWNFWDGGTTPEGAKSAISYMTGNHERNISGKLHHLCLAVCEKDAPGVILGWCGLDGTVHPERPEIFVLLHETARNKGYGTQCVRMLIEYAFTVADLSRVHGGCDKDNIASFRMMQKGGMTQYSTEENGDPLFMAYKDEIR